MTKFEANLESSKMYSQVFVSCFYGKENDKYNFLFESKVRHERKKIFIYLFVSLSEENTQYL